MFSVCGLACDGLAESGMVAAAEGDCGAMAASCCGSAEGGRATELPLLSTVAEPGWLTAVDAVVGFGTSLRLQPASAIAIRQAVRVRVFVIGISPVWHASRHPAHNECMEDATIENVRTAAHRADTGSALVRQD